MSKGVALLLVLVFLTATCIIMAEPASSSAEVAENSWVQKTPMNEARSGLGVAVVNGKIYAIGGIAESGSVGTNEEYDPETDTWTKKASMPTPRSDFGIAVYENKIYCIGGNTGGVNEVYDPETDTWKTKAPMLSPTTFQSAEANVVNGKIYLIRDGTVHEVYDPAKDKWATRALMPLRTVGVYASAVFDNKIYILGDLYNSTNDYDYLGTEIYDPETDNWSAGAPLPSSDVFWGAGVTTGEMAPERIYVFNQFDGTTRVYNPVDNSWEAAAAMPTSRIAFGVAVVNDMFYLIGGFIQSYFYSLPLGVTRYATNEQYTPFGYGKALPKISVVSPENMTYNATDVTLDFTLNKPAVWIGFSLDGRDNVTITGNATLLGLKNGLHNVTVYARDEAGNTGTSEPISFSVDVPASFPFVPVLAAVVTAAVIGVGLLVYFKKRKR